MGNWNKSGKGGGGASYGRARPMVDIPDNRIREVAIGFLARIGAWPKQSVGLLPGVVSGTTVWDPYATPADTQGDLYWRKHGEELADLFRQFANSKATTPGGVLMVDPVRFGFLVAGDNYDAGDAIGGVLQEAAEAVGMDATTGADAAFVQAITKVLGAKR